MLLSEIAAFTFSEIQSKQLLISKLGSHGVLLCGIQFSGAKTFDSLKFFALVPGLAEALNAKSPTASALLSEYKSDFLSLLRTQIDQHAPTPQAESFDPSNFYVDFGIGSESLSDITIFKEHRNNNYYIHSSITGRSVPLSRDDLELKLGAIKKEEKAAILATAKLGKTLYHPGLPPGPQELSEDSKTVFQVQVDCVINTYTPPLWKALTPTSEILHPTLDKFFSYLFPNPDCRRSVLNWIYSLLFCPMQRIPIMILFSSGGVGKGTLTEKILSSLVGPHNSIGSAADQHGNFDSHIGTKLLYAPEEADMDNVKKMDRFKNYYDGRVSLSKKHANITGSDVIPTRFVLSSNFASSLYMIRDARKFTIPDVHKASHMRDSFSKKEDKFFKEFPLNYQEQCNLAHWLQNNAEPFDDAKDLRHERDFDTLCEHHLTDWFKTLKNALTVKETMTHKEVKKLLSDGAKAPGLTKIKDQVARYEFETRTKLCSFSNSPTDAGVVYTSHIYTGVKEDKSLGGIL